MKEVADAAADMAPAVAHVVVVWHATRAADAPWNAERDVRWDELLAAQPARFETEPLDSEHPLFIAYTSGTTGRPKGSVHVHGGFLVKIAEEVAYQTDLAPGRDPVLGDRPRLDHGPVGDRRRRGRSGATVFLFDGAPNHPAPDRLWDMVERHRITTLGVSPTLIRALIPAGDEHVRAHDLSSLRVLASTGEPWNPEPVPVAAREGRRRPVPDHQHLRRHGGRRVLPVSAADHAS